MLKFRRFQISEDLTFVFDCQCPCGLQLDNQNILDQHIRKVLTDQSAILIKHPQRMLLPNVDSELEQTMKKRALINFFKVTVTEIKVYLVRRLPDSIT